MRWAVVLLASAGCGSVLGLEPLYECPSTDDDCDELLDDVDPCPADPGDAMDGDGDGVGDACDPNLQAPGDTIAVFDSFATQNAAWRVFAGAAQWRWRDSALAQDQIASGAIERPIDLIEQPTVEVLLDVEFPEEGSSVGVYVLTSSGPGANVPLECRVVHYATHDDLVMLLRSADDTIVVYTDTAVALPGKRTDGLRIYGGQLPDGTVRCRARYGDADALILDWKGVVTPRAMMDRVGLRTIKASAEFHAAVVYWVPL